MSALSRAVAWLLARVLYRLSVYGRDRVPRAGGCLVLCNHASYADWFVVRAALPRTPAVVIDDPEPSDDLLRRAADALAAGRLVLMFPEGRVTRTGHMLPFGPAVERLLVLAPADVTVIPAGTDGLWGGWFSYHAGAAFRKRPRAVRPYVGVLFGSETPPPNPLPQRERGDQTAGLTSPLPVGEGAGGRGRLGSSSPSPCGGGGRGEGSVFSAPNLRLLVQEAAADCAVRQSDYAPLVHRAFVRNAAKFRNLFRPCIVDNAAGERILSWGKTYVGAACVARYLGPKVAADANVGAWLPTGLGGALANLAVAFLGKASVNLNYTAGTDAVRSAVRQAGVKLVVTSKRFLQRVPLDLPPEVERVYLEDVLESVTKGQRIRTFLSVLLLPGWVLDRWVWGFVRHKPDGTLTIVFSSGSTGEPKGVVLTHRNVGSNVDAAVRTIQIRPDDILFGVLPFFHSFGYTVALWAPLVAAATAVYYPDPRGAREVGEIVRKNRATLMLSTATFLRFYLRRCDAGDFATIRLLICGAEKLPVKLQDEFRAKFGILPLEGYGCTELSPVVSTNLFDTTADGFTQVCNVRGTVGQPLAGLCVRAFTQDTREPLPAGEDGVLCGKGPNVMAGYLHQPGKTKEAVRDGWYSTGDVGRIEPEGFIRITGRVSRFAKIAGEMVPLERVEEELLDLYGGGDRVLAVAAVPDEGRGERVVVLVLPDAAGRLLELLDGLAKRGLPNLWVPSARDVYPVESLPLLGSGKLDLKRVGELAKEMASGGRQPPEVPR
ncbi:MAG: AMP-binding protein [Gemmataceae bacterium]|nr:AMP-binding protein [Gemmataceae bacterium]